MAHVSLTVEDGNEQYKRVGYQNTTHNVNTSPNRNKKEEMHHYTHSINIPQNVIKTHQYKTQNEFELLPNKVAVSPLHCYYSKFEYRNNHTSKQRHKSHKMPKVNRNINGRGGDCNNEVEKESNKELIQINKVINDDEVKKRKKEVFQTNETQLVLFNEKTRPGSNVQSEEKSILQQNFNDDNYIAKEINGQQLINQVIEKEKNDITEYSKVEQISNEAVNVNNNKKLTSQLHETYDANQHHNQGLNLDYDNKTQKPLKAINNHIQTDKDNNNNNVQDNQLFQSFSHQFNQTNHLDESVNTLSNKTETSLNREIRRPLEIVKRTISLRKPTADNLQQTPDTIDQTSKQLHYATLVEQVNNLTEANNNQDHYKHNKSSLLIDISQEVKSPIQTEPINEMTTIDVNNMLYKKKRSSKDIKTHLRQNLIEKECISNCVEVKENNNNKLRSKCSSRNNYSNKETETKMDTIKDVKPATETFESNYKDTNIINADYHQWQTKYTLINTESFQLNSRMNNDYNHNNTKVNNMEADVLFKHNNIKTIPKQYEDYEYHQFNEEQQNNDMVLKNRKKIINTDNNHINTNDNYQNEMNYSYPSKYETITSSERNNDTLGFKLGFDQKNYLNTNFTSNTNQYEKSQEDNEINNNNVKQNANLECNLRFHHSVKAHRQYLVTNNNINRFYDDKYPKNENTNQNNTSNYYLPSSQYLTDNQKSNYDTPIDKTNNPSPLSSQVNQIQSNNIMNIPNNTVSFINTSNNSVQLKKRILASEGNVLNLQNKYELEMIGDLNNTKPKVGQNHKEKGDGQYSYNIFNNQTKEYKDICSNSNKQNNIKYEDHFCNLPSDKSGTKDLTNRYKAFKEMKERNKDTNINYDKFLNHNKKEYIPLFNPNIQSEANLINQVTNDKCVLNKETEKINYSLNTPSSVPYDSYDNYCHQRQFSSGSPIIIKKEKDNQKIGEDHHREEGYSINNNNEILDSDNNKDNLNTNYYTYEISNCPMKNEKEDREGQFDCEANNEVKRNTTNNNNNFYLYYGFGNQISKDLSYNKYKNIIDRQKSKKSTLFESTVIHNKTKTCLCLSPTDFYYNTTCTIPNQILIQHQQKDTNKSLLTKENRKMNYGRRELFDYQNVFNHNKRKAMISRNTKEALLIKPNNNRNFKVNNAQKGNKPQFDKRNYVNPNVEYGKLFMNLDEFKKEKIQYI